jgi:hypothetical protein
MLKPEFMSESDYNDLCELCYRKAMGIKEQNLRPASEMNIFDLTDLMITLELEKIEKNLESDSKLNYNDEIESIEYVGVKETVDITVTGDNLFYCNGILTKNSIGLPQTLDAFFGLITSEELEDLDQLMIKQLKNRWGDTNYYKRFVIGIDRSKMKLYNLEETAQSNVKSEPKKDEPVFDRNDKKKKFDIGDIS